MTTLAAALKRLAKKVPAKTSIIRIRCHPKLKALIIREARKRGLSLSQFVCMILAKHLGRPELARVPLRVGRRSFALKVSELDALRGAME